MKYNIGKKVTVKSDPYQTFPPIYGGKTGIVTHRFEYSENNMYCLEFNFYDEYLELIKKTCIFKEEQLFIKD